jgi:Fe-S oxidoreductase
MPVFAPQTFVQWFRARPVRNHGKPLVMVWPDTFNNHFFPEVGKAAVEVLEDAGYQVVIPSRPLCCGRPLYDYGMLTLAKRMLRQILDGLRPQIAAGVPVIGLEPSCVAVFRDELVNLFPHDDDAQRLSRKTYLFSEFMQNVATHYQPPQLARQAIVHGHCHQKALIGMKAEKGLLTKLGLDYQILDSGCCGMAGSFGFERGHYHVSRQVGELALLPAVRAAAKHTLIMSDGFSCREQIAQTTDRQALHLAQVMRLAMHQQSEQLPSVYPERQVQTQSETTLTRATAATAILIGVGVLAVGAIVWKWRAKRTISLKEQRHEPTRGHEPWA